MLDNVLIVSIGGVLAAICLLTPMLFASVGRLARLLLVVLFFGAAFGGLLLLTDERSACAVVMVGLVFSTIGKLATINFKMVHSAHYPKHRRCY
jgi:hypothetical protein